MSDDPASFAESADGPNAWPFEPETRAALLRLALDLPASPGVYLMKSQDGRVIYVGKAKNLPKRVSSYFRTKTLSARISLLVSHIRAFDFMVTATEKEALILENSLIKKHRPKFNVVLRDDKTYPSLRLSASDPFPRLEIVRRPAKDGSTIFGPFPSSGALRETLKLVERLFPLRKCARPDVKKTGRPCLNYQIGRCCGPCRPEFTEEEYRQLAEQVRLFFKGRRNDLVASLEQAMRQSAARYDFEAAAKLRDRLADVRQTLEKQSMVLGEDLDLDVWALAAKAGFVQAAVLTLRSGVVTGCRPLSVEGLALADEKALLSLMGQYYAEGGWAPDELLLPLKLPAGEAALFLDWLGGFKGGPVKAGVPARDEERLKLLRLAEDNARAALDERLERLAGARGTLAEIMSRLHLPAVPRRIECFDLAHLQGQAAVAGLVVMEEGELKKGQYRKFRIKQALGGDDYGGLQEVVKRRFRPGRADPVKAPDLLLIDGGRGQLTAVMAAFEELALQPPALAGIAKDREGGGPDRIFLPGRKNPADLRPGSAGLLLLAKLRDEAHRFCRTYHHDLRTKEMLASPLAGVKGLGPAKLKLLRASYPSLADLDAASEADLQAKLRLPQAAVEELKAQVRRQMAGGQSRTPPKKARPDASSDAGPG
ncbi:MAG: excinuclease ABC subunit UvrC [Deltaproteobacteria bacterium]|nr:excinuclease ABC subunit UvrC [Deltaproteobacteria bacterium]